MSAFVINPYAFGAAFDPLTLPNLHVWLDASDTTTTWQDTSATTAATADNDPVALIQDKSGGGHDFSINSAASTTRPLLRSGANGQNSLPVLSFDGSNDILSDASDINDFANIGYAYIFAAVEDTNPTGGNATHAVAWVSRDASSATRFYLTTRVNVGDNRFGGLVRLSTGSLNTIGSASDANFNILSYITEHADGNHFLRANGSQIATGSFGAANFANVSSLSRSIGGLANDAGAGTAGFYFVGKIGEVLIGTGQLTDAQRDACETYLRNKWGTA